MAQNYFKTWNDNSLFIFCILFSNVAAFYFAFLLAFGRPLWGQSLVSYQASAVAATFAMLGTAHLLLKPDIKHSSFTLQNALSPIRLLVMALLGAIFCVILSKVAFAGVSALFGTSAAHVSFDTGLRGPPSSTDILVLFCATGILVPLGEELLFRRWLFGRLAAIGRVSVFMPVSIAFFGFVHIGQSPVKVVTIMALGALCAWLFVRSRNVIWPWLAHAVNNTAALSLALVGW